MTHRNETDTDLPAADNVVPFPVNAKLTRARRAYRAELERFERLAMKASTHGSISVFSPSTSRPGAKAALLEPQLSMTNCPIFNWLRDSADPRQPRAAQNA
jgi:hypothetical protein